MKNTGEVAILMSSYNGEQYISEQIDSILNQTFNDWTLYIRDDGSSDGTVDIIKSYSQKYPNIKIVTDNIAHRGVKDSFLYLLESVESEYYFFCDQDDVWFPNKVSDSIEIIEKQPTGIPLLVATDLQLVDANLNVIEKSMWEACGMRRKINNTEYLKVRDYLTGCTMCFNKITRNNILNNDKINKFGLIHDQLASISVIAGEGNIVIIDKQTISYRQHSNNVIGGKKIRNRLLYRLSHLKGIINKEIKRYKAAKRYLNMSSFSFFYLRWQSID